MYLCVPKTLSVLMELWNHLSGGMIGLFCFVLAAVLASPFKSKLRLEAENAVLRHQLNVLSRRLHGRVRLTSHDRWFFIQLYRWFPSILQVLTIIRPRRSCVAQGRLSLLLALEVIGTGRAAADRGQSRPVGLQPWRRAALLLIA
jgi:hypothetical protein